MIMIKMKTEEIKLRVSSSSRKGFVLVSVLMLSMLLISCATAFTWFVRMQVKSVYRTRSALTNRSMALVLSSNVISALVSIAEEVKADSPVQRWYQPFVFNIPDLGIWVVQVTPLDDKIPIGKLFLPDGDTLRRELTEVWRELWDKLGHRELEQLILDFMDRNSKPRVGSAENENFINRQPFDISELLALSSDVTHDIFYGNGTDPGFSDYCTVFSDGKINLNVAPVHVMELLPGLDRGDLAEKIAEVRTEKVLESFSDVQNLPGASPRTSTLLTNIADFKSRYFNIRLEYLSPDGEGGSSYNVIFDRTSRNIVRWEEI